LATLCIINPEKDLNEEKMSKESLQYFDVYKLKKTNIISLSPITSRRGMKPGKEKQ